MGKGSKGFFQHHDVDLKRQNLDSQSYFEQKNKTHSRGILRATAFEISKQPLLIFHVLKIDRGLPLFQRNKRGKPAQQI